MLVPLLDAATTFAMELEAPTPDEGGAFGTLDRATALAELGRISGHCPEVLRDARRIASAHDEPAAASLLGIASVWVVFADDD
jgi:hypothetical protein